MTEYTGIDNLEVMLEARNYNAFLHSIVAAQIEPQDRVLDFGAGSGTFAVPLLQRGINIVCVEQDARLKETLHRAHVPVVTTLEEIAPSSVDLIYSLNVLEHIEDDYNAIIALAERLRDGGRLLLYVPAFPVLFSAMDRKVGHHRRYRRGPLVQLLNKGGFRVLRAIHVDSLGFILSIVYRILGNNSGEINKLTLRLYDRLFFPVSRALDYGFRHCFGKNLLIVAEKR
jgi:SAM-dependent methyltransferase